jgi:hypothetical protein
LKPIVANHGRTRALFASFSLVGLAASVSACGSNSSQGAGDAFVGTWSCPTLPASMRTIVITESLDNSLTLTGPADAGSDFCATDEWVYSGTTVTMQNQTSCLGGAGGTQVINVASFKMTVNGSSLIVNASETASGADAGTQKLSISGTCKKQ